MYNKLLNFSETKQQKYRTDGTHTQRAAEKTQNEIIDVSLVLFQEIHKINLAKLISFRFTKISLKSEIKN